ncbi:hypothetical protein [Methylocystis parvus]|uniref:hypothetical protein n=1 Tax=Methylocystis parvus TaxID=134 RepID=UPI003C7669FF
MNLKSNFSLVSLLVLAFTTGALASTASQREYKRGYADCSAGRWDQEQHGASYKKGCDAAEAKKNSGGAATPDASQAAPAEKPFMDASVPAKDKQACVRAVKKQTHNPKVVVIGAVSSEANNTVTLGVGPEKAPWRCLVKRGKVSDVMSQTNEGAL